jgi:hypothetical protein
MYSDLTTYEAIPDLTTPIEDIGLNIDPHDYDDGQEDEDTRNEAYSLALTSERGLSDQQNVVDGKPTCLMFADY